MKEFLVTVSSSVFESIIVDEIEQDLEVHSPCTFSSLRIKLIDGQLLGLQFTG